VLTGDIVKSKRLTPDQLAAVRRRLERCVDDLNGFLDGVVIGHIDFYRGDGWQMLLALPDRALRAAVFLRTALIAFENCDTRIAVGVGPVEIIDKERISKSTGRAFECSGRALDGMKMDQCLDLLGDTNNGRCLQALRISTHLCDALIRQLSPRRAEAIFWAIQGCKHEEIAQKMEPPLDRSTVTKSLNAAGWREIESFIGHKWL